MHMVSQLKHIMTEELKNFCTLTSIKRELNEKCVLFVGLRYQWRNRKSILLRVNQQFTGLLDGV